MTRAHLFVTNDFPPKVGGIQSMLWELWRRLDPGSFAVVTTRHPDSAAFDAAQPFTVHRLDRDVLWPTPGLARVVDDLARACDAELVVLDPALPLGLIGDRLSVPYAVVVHGSEVTVPGRLPLARAALAGVLRGASCVVAAGGYPLAEAERAAGTTLPAVVVPPGVDVERFVPLDESARREARRRLGLPPDGRVLLSVSRLVPRKGMDVLVRAAARLAPGRPDLVVAIAGTGRDRRRLERLADREAAPVRLMGAIPFDDLPALYGCADVFAMLCRDRWAGLEQEGYGIVFLEAAACGVPAVAGRSGGSHEAVLDGVTGVVIESPDDVDAAAAALGHLLDEPTDRAVIAAAARARVETESSYDVLAARLAEALGTRLASTASALGAHVADESRIVPG